MRAGVTSDGVVFRLFYPHRQKGAPHNAPWLVVNLGETLQVCVIAALQKGCEFSSGEPSWWITVVLFRCLAAIAGILFPANDVRLPATLDADDRGMEDAPLVVFSHGLLGSGAEDFLVATEWASHGYRVAVVLHCDGSATLQYDAQGRRVWFEPCPKSGPEKLQFRCTQVKKRSAEVRSVVHHYCRDGDVILAGFSYGCSTVLLAAQEMAILEPTVRVSCVVAMDGWFYNGAQFPPDIFGVKEDDSAPRRSFPTYFLVSERASEWPENFDQVKRLVNASREEDDCNDTLEIVTGAAHSNFSEQFFWNPLPFGVHSCPSLLVLADCDPSEMLYDITARTVQFLKNHVPTK